MRARVGLALLALAALCAAGDDPTKDLDYGPYAHYLKSKQQASLSRRNTKLMRTLRGLYYQCTKCRGRGTILVVTRERYYDRRRDEWIPALEEKQTCDRCKGDRKLFRESVAAKFMSNGLPPGVRRSRSRGSIERYWKKRLEDTGVAFNKIPRQRYNVIGTWGTVTGGRNALWPLRFKLHAINGKHEWFLHVPEIDGPYGQLPMVSGTQKVKKVLAGDMLLLEENVIARVCGITIPTPDNKIQKNPVRRPDEAALKFVKELIEGKEVKLTPDKHSALTLDGHALVFVEFTDAARGASEKKDIGTLLLRAGLARVHPKHAHMRKTKYRAAEKTAKEAKAGVWAE